jgi:hypothetical protein
MIEIKKFEVSATKHKTLATNKELAWQIWVRVQFASGDPSNWGEFRAYAASWRRIKNRKQPDNDWHDSSLVTDTSLPLWGMNQGPPKKDGLAWRLHNDQDVEIFYKNKVPKVPRSDPKSKETLPDDGVSPNDPGARGIDFGDWHIIMSDEPSSAPIQEGDYVEYWLRAEFQIRDPQTRDVLPLRKQLFCRVRGRFPEYAYRAQVDDLHDDELPFFDSGDPS